MIILIVKYIFTVNLLFYTIHWIVANNDETSPTEQK
jgi:phage shock protein PspC (stress-responsive transcriptional regulator)